MVKFYSESNRPNYFDLMKVPVDERIPELSKKIGISDLAKIIMAEITKFQNCFNVIRPMNPDQIAQCAEDLILSAEEDFLSLQDLVIFFEGAKLGKYGKVYDRLDQQVIFEMLEVYRHQRHIFFMAFEEERHAQYKTVPVNDRFVSDAANKENNLYRQALGEHLKQQYSQKSM